MTSDVFRFLLWPINGFLGVFFHLGSGTTLINTAAISFSL